MKNIQATKYTFFILLLGLSNSMFSQSIKQEKMEQLNYLVGEWIGTSTVYENGVAIKKGAAYEHISYDLDQSIMVIELNTEFLQLHTIITYDEDDQKYYYHRFSKDGAAIYPADYIDGKFTVWKNDTTRFIFTTSEAGGFIEYGEQLMNGEWVRLFEDTFMNTQ